MTGHGRPGGRCSPAAAWPQGRGRDGARLVVAVGPVFRAQGSPRSRERASGQRLPSARAAAGRPLVKALFIGLTAGRAYLQDENLGQRVTGWSLPRSAVRSTGQSPHPSRQDTDGEVPVPAAPPVQAAGAGPVTCDVLCPCGPHVLTCQGLVRSAGPRGNVSCSACCVLRAFCRVAEETTQPAAGENKRQWVWS